MTWQFMLPILVGIITQIIKLVIDVNLRRFSWKNIFGYGGMPSGHTATVTSLCITVAWFEGIQSTSFTIAFIVATFIIWDALGLRQHLGQHAYIINKIIKDLPDYKESKYPYLNNKIGHTLPQVFVGGILSALVTTLALYFL